jgi:hypothetical protein
MVVRIKGDVGVPGVGAPVKAGFANLAGGHILRRYARLRGLLPGGRTYKELRMRALAVRDGAAGDEPAEGER